jgi:hypothetical protein
MNHQETMTALDAMGAAHRIAFAPFSFQAACVLRDRGILARLGESPDGELLGDIAAAAALSLYGTRILIEGGVGAGLVREAPDGRYRLTKVGWMFQHDAAVRANTDFAREVGYAALAHLDEAVESGQPAGLRVFGDWPNVYEGLASLPEPTRRAWFGFDHHYSDAVFPLVLKIVLERGPCSLLDIGGNTGKWALACATRDPELALTIVDLPGQLRVADENLSAAGVRDRVRLHPADILDPEATLPGPHEAISMSQFLDCFSEEQIGQILRRCLDALAPGGRIYIVEPFVDRQRFAAAKFCLQMTSIYFCAIANGCSRMYDSETFLSIVRGAGLEIEREHDGLGMGHTLLVCKARD